MKALVLAAGLGTRLRPYTDHTPKPLFTVNGRPLLAMAIEKLHAAGVESVIVNTHHHHSQVETYLAETTFPLPVAVCHETRILGTGGAIRNVSAHWHPGPLLVVNADIVHNVDLARVVRFHQSHGYPVTMVMHDREEFNTVAVDEDDFVTRFGCSRGEPHDRRIMAFTGLHVVDRRVLDYLPPQGPAHIIDAYSRMLKNGERIKAYIVKDHYWQDIGTPPRYQAAVFDQMAPLAFETAFGRRPAPASVQRHMLYGDGSDRQWCRLASEGDSLIMVDHGIRTEPGWQEVDAYVAIGKFLGAKGIPVPRIYLHDNCAGFVFMQDWGDEHLQTLIARSGEDRRRQLYHQVIDQWVRMAVEGGSGFDPSWGFQTARYDSWVILEKECRYFVEAFVQTYLGWQQPYDELHSEFELLADRILTTQIGGFLHRDFQSRNIMVRDGRVGFIDFQGGRLGPIQYDLASLLIDPYTALPQTVQDQLRDYGTAELQKRYGMDPAGFLQGFALCAVARNLQILGAYGFLSRIKGKTQFETYIPVAVKSLVRNLSRAAIDLPGLKTLAHRIAAHFGPE